MSLSCLIGNPSVVRTVYHRRDIIAMQLLVFVVLYHHAVRKMVLQPIMLPVSAGQLNVLLLVPIVIHLLVFVELYHLTMVVVVTVVVVTVPSLLLFF